MTRDNEDHDRPAGGRPATEAPDWDALFPPDPELMASAEGDTRGLAELKRAARERIERLERT